MDKVLLQAELLGEAILDSREYISMRLAEQAVIDDDGAQQLIQSYTNRKDAFQKELAKKPLDHDAMAKAGEAVKETEDAIAAHPMINAMRDTSGAYTDMMRQVNGVISRIVNGEPEGGCAGSCEGCGGSCGH
ncbi:MAG: YlbF family regulator [Bacillota bacterium]